MRNKVGVEHQPFWETKIQPFWEAKIQPFWETKIQPFWETKITTDTMEESLDIGRVVPWSFYHGLFVGRKNSF